MQVSHDPWLVALSVLVAIQGAYVGLSLAVRISSAGVQHRRALLAGSSISLGVAIWSMHFVGMLAARLPFPVDYLVFPTLLSFLVSVLVVGIGVFAATAGSLTPGRVAAAAVFMGLGIVSMHYIGMEALHASAHMQHAPLFIVASIVIAIATSGLALWLAAGSGPTPRFLPAIALGIAISGMHYTAMAGMTIFPHPNPQPLPPALSPDLLAIVVAVVAFVVSGLFLLILVPDHLDRRLSGETVATDKRPVDTQAMSQPHSAADGGEQVEAPRRPAGSHLPVERDRATYLLPVTDIVAVRANAHYTSVYDGRTTYFCSLPIGDVEGRLADARFVRVHRSHIINMDHVIALRNTGDNCQIELTAGPDPYLVPVSRSRTAWVKSQFGLNKRRALS